MNPSTPDPMAVAPAPAPATSLSAPNADTIPAGVRSTLPWLLGLVALLLALLVAGAVSLLWQRVGFVQEELARRTLESQTQASEVRAVAAQAEALTQELQARLAVAEIKLSEVSLQRGQLEELMLALSRSQDDSLVQDLESALRLAMQQAQLSGSALPLVSAMQAADQRIARAAQPRLNPVQRALQRDIERIKAAALTDVPTLVLRVEDLVRRVDDWPLYNDAPEGARPQGAPASATAAASSGARAESPRNPVSGLTPSDHLPVAQPQADAEQAEAAAVGASAQAGWTRMSRAIQVFWGQVWASVSESGQELVRVSRIDRPEAVLLAPEQAFFLRENLKLRFLNVRLGLLGRQLEAVDADLKATEAALARYFDTRTPPVRQALQELTELRSELPLLVLPRPDESLAALAAAAGGR